MGKTRDIFTKIKDTKGTFHAKMGTIKDRNGMDLIEAEDIRRGGKNTQKLQILKDDAVKALHSICQQIWKTQQWPQEWKMSVFIPIPKKGNVKECSSSVQFSNSVVSNSLQPHGLQHAMLPCPSPTPRAHVYRVVMPFNHFILCHSLLLLPSIFTSWERMFKLPHNCIHFTR